MELRSYALPFTLFLFALINYIHGMDVASGGHKILPTSENNRVQKEKSCKPVEYLHEGLCCQKCPAGTHVLQHCHTHGGKCSCTPCHSGKNFTEADNGLQFCLTCRRCRGDEETVHNCTSTSNTVCQCKVGRYCIPIASCEFCEKCTERCPDGQVIVQDCNATSDIVCGKETAQTGGSFQEIYLIILILLIIGGAGLGAGLGAVLWCQRRRRKKISFDHINQSEEKESTDVSVQSLGAPLLTVVPHAVITVKERTPPSATARSFMPRPPLRSYYIPVCECDVPPINKPASATKCTIHLAANNVKEESSIHLENQEEPANTTVLHSQNEPPPIGTFTGPSLNRDMYADVGISPKDAPTIFKSFINAVPVKTWKMFMRTMLLNDNDIEAAIYDNPNNVHEQHYAMLVKWKNKFGNEATINKLLMGLCKMKLKACYENIENELIQKGILNRHNSKMMEDTH